MNARRYIHRITPGLLHWTPAEVGETLRALGRGGNRYWKEIWPLTRPGVRFLVYLLKVLLGSLENRFED